MLKPPLQPMLLTDCLDPFDSDEYIFEIKWDGYRCLVFINQENIYLQSRNQKNLTPYFPELSDVITQVSASNIVLDGEICCLDNEGKPVFEHLQGRIWKKYTAGTKIKYPASLVIWDILAVNEKETYQLPLSKRRLLLKQYVTSGNSLILSPYFKQSGKKLYQTAEKEGLEGIVAKQIDSIYEFRRSKYWLKIKIWQYKEVFIAGYDYDQTGLVVGEWKQNQLFYMGKVKISLTPEETEALFRFLPTIKLDKTPSIMNPGLSNINWVKPKIKCQIRYTEITNNQTFRHGYVVDLLI